MSKSSKNTASQFSAQLDGIKATQGTALTIFKFKDGSHIQVDLNKTGGKAELSVPRNTALEDSRAYTFANSVEGQPRMDGTTLVIPFNDGSKIDFDLSEPLGS